MKTFVVGLTLCLDATLSLSLQAQDAAPGGIPLANGQKIAFLGDSITAAGARQGGYCQLVLDGLQQEGLEVTGIFAGISGHKSNQMLARLEKDVLSKKPDWMTLSCGVNDVWHGAKGVNLDDYKKNITAIVDQAQAAGVKVMLLTSTMIKEDQENELNQKLSHYNGFLKELAQDKSCLIADLNTEMQEALRSFSPDAPKGKQLTSDGVHMNAYGNHMMALGVLKAFGVSESKLAAAEQSWKNKPGSKSMQLQLSMSLREYEQLQSKLDQPVKQVFQQFLNEKKAELLK